MNFSAMFALTDYCLYSILFSDTFYKGSMTTNIITLTHPTITSAIVQSSLRSLSIQQGDIFTSYTIILSSNVIALEKNAFRACYGLEKVTLHDGILELPYGLFAYCYRLHCVHLPLHLQRINEFVFYKCHLLSRIAIPPNVKYIAHNAFNECVSLTTVHYQRNSLDVLPTNVRQFSHWLIDYCTHTIALSAKPEQYSDVQQYILCKLLSYQQEVNIATIFYIFCDLENDYVNSERLAAISSFKSLSFISRRLDFFSYFTPEMIRIFKTCSYKELDFILQNIINFTTNIHSHHLSAITTLSRQSIFHAINLSQDFLRDFRVCFRPNDLLSSCFRIFHNKRYKLHMYAWQAVDILNKMLASDCFTGIGYFDLSSVAALNIAFPRLYRKTVASSHVFLSVSSLALHSDMSKCSTVSIKKPQTSLPRSVGK